MRRRFLIVAAATVALAGCASTGAVPRPFPLPGGTPAATVPSAAGSPARRPPADGYAISSTALGYRGVPYRFGGSDPSGFDCSGLVQFVFEQHGILMPREARDQFDVGAEVSVATLAPGDLVFFQTVAPGASHVGIALGGDQFVHAPSSNGVVRVDRLSAQYWSNRFIGARRIQ